VQNANGFQGEHMMAESIRERTETRVRDIAAYIEEHAADHLTLDMLAQRADMSPAHLQRTFTRIFGMSPKCYQTALRVESFKRHLREGESVIDATYRAGFGSSRGAYEATQLQVGMTPGAYRRRGAGLTVRYSIAASPLGLVLVGATSVGVCTVMLADDEATLLAALDAEFGAAELVRDDEGLRAQTRAVTDHLAGGARPDLPLDLLGTEFQQRVWTALQTIPSGTSISYGELARAIGRPSAQRAVASACADNHVAVLVPCHRVVRADGGLGGYKWGVQRKKRLLEHEAASR
jgi:AraC family transcriptional regulator of adaptative response/methylated-DNA-[protein]-cysteine methyltransferase